MDVGKYVLNARRLQPIQVLEQARKHRAIVGQHRIVAVLKQRRLFDLDLLAGDTPAIDAAAHHPVHAAVTVIGAAVAVLAEGAATRKSLKRQQADYCRILKSRSS